MSRRSYVQINGVLYEKGTEPVGEGARGAGPAILGDLPDFVSPIDGKAYSGRAGLREHCRRHDVVPNADLAGLPTLKTDTDIRPKDVIKRDAAARKELVIRAVDQQYRKYNA